MNPSNQDQSPTNSSPKPNRRSKKRYGLLAGAALAASVALGGNSLLNVANAQVNSSSAPSAGLLNSTGVTFQTSSGLSNQGTAFQGPGRGGDRGGMPRGNGASGTISSISGNTLTLKQGDVVVIQATHNANTVYTKAGQTITLADLKVGQLVSVRTTTASDGAVSVSQVDVILNHAGGTISALDANSLTITKPDNTTVKVSLNSATKYQDLGKTINLSDLKTGMRVEVAGETGTDGSLSAEVVNVQHDQLGGTITAINGSTLTVQVDGRGGKGGGRPNGGAATNPAPPPSGTGNSATPSAPTNPTTTTKNITVSDSTVYLEGGQTTQLSSLAVGQRINAAGTLSSDGNSLTALQIVVELPRYDGQVTSVNGSTIVLQDRSGTSRTIEVNSSTKYLNGQATASLNDVKAGVTLHVEGTVDSSGKMTASLVQLGQGPGQGPGRGR